MNLAIRGMDAIPQLSMIGYTVKCSVASTELAWELVSTALSKVP